MDKKYGSYTDEDLNDWQSLPANSRVLTSSGFGAWLMRRDNRRDKRKFEEIRQIRPCMRNPEQEGHEEYNKGWNDAIKEFLCNIDNFKEIDNENRQM